MPRKKATPAKMLKVIELGAQNGASRTPSMFSLIKDDPTSSPELIAYAWEKAARAALSINDLKFAMFPDANGKLVRHEMPADYIDVSARALRLTFEKFKLDPEDPWSWKMLAQYLSMIFFWKILKKRGAPKKWTPKLLMEVEKEAAKHSGLPNTKVAHRLANDKKSPFYAKGVDTKAGVEGLRKQLNKIGRSKRSGTK
jgi:hypothetical protein